MNMTDFQKGWWNCFVSFASELLLARRDGDMEVTVVLKGANISVDEINYILAENDFCMCPRLKDVLETYRNTLIGKSSNYGNDDKKRY